MRPLQLHHWFVLSTLGVTGCGIFLGTDDLSFDRPSETETSTSANGTGSMSNAQGTGGSASGGSGTTTGGNGGSSTSTSTSSGGAQGLIADELLARYFIDEAASGTPPISALDSAPLPADLDLRYDGNLFWTEVNGHRGLNYVTAAGNSDAFFIVGNDPSGKLWQLSGATHVTIEMVVELAGAASGGSPLLYFGNVATPNGYLALWATPDLVSVIVGGAGGLFYVPFNMSGRAVLHAVIEPSGIQVFVNGTPASPNGTVTTATVDLADSDRFLLGNNPTYSMSPSGTIYYAAIYTKAFSDPEVAHNTQLLLASDDTQP